MQNFGLFVVLTSSARHQARRKVWSYSRYNEVKWRFLPTDRVFVCMAHSALIRKICWSSKWSAYKLSSIGNICTNICFFFIARSTSANVESGTYLFILFRNRRWRLFGLCFWFTRNKNFSALFGWWRGKNLVHLFTFRMHFYRMPCKWKCYLFQNIEQDLLKNLKVRSWL